MGEKVHIIATGDSFITQRLPRDQKALHRIRDLFSEADVKFTNFEVTVHDFEAFPSASSGGTWAVARPFVLKELQWLGINLMAWANNHTLDWSHNGLLSTLKHIDDGDLIHAGVGRNLAEASQPKYLDTKNGRVALIASTSTFESWHRAGAQRPDVLGRPGVNPLSYQAIHRVHEQDFNALKRVAKFTEINATQQLNQQEGFSKQESGVFSLGGLHFEIGDPGTITKMNHEDSERIGQSIYEASRQADVVLVSHHAHEMKGMNKEQPASFLCEFARFCIDQGAHAFIGHGPHILRGIEIYKNRPIFYSLGDFIFQNDTVERQPTEFYQLYNLGPNHHPADGMDRRSQNGTRGLAANPSVFESVIASFSIDEGHIHEIKLIPIALGFELPRGRKGRPSIASLEQGNRILDHLSQLSASFGTEIIKKNGIGLINL